MRAHRTVEDLARRVGLTLDTGSAIRALPYAEGISVTTLMDDWRLIRTPPFPRMFAVSNTRTPDVANFSGIRLVAGAAPVHLIHFSGPSGVSVRMSMPAAAVVETPTAVGSVGSNQSSVLQGRWPVAPDSGNSLASLETFLVPSLAGTGTFNQLLDPTNAILPGYMQRGLYLLPGEQLWWLSLVVNQSLSVSAVWSEQAAQAGDALTAGPPRRV